MPERSFGRTIRYRRTKLGISQTKLGELVGRSATTIRSWERDASAPTDESVLSALAAVLGLDRRALFEKAGAHLPVEESSPTVEEALATLAPDPVTAPGSEVEEDLGDPAHPEDDAAPDRDDSERVSMGDSRSEAPDLAGVREPKTTERASIAEPDQLPETSPMPQPTPTPSFSAPPDPYFLTEPTPRLVEPSYVEDTSQRQLYRVRNLATLVILVGLVIVLLWAVSNGLDALGAWWNDFFGTLKL